MNPGKVCSKCHQPKALCEFSSDKRHSDGKQSHCRECQYAQQREHKRRHPEAVKASKRREAIKHAERYRERKHQWYLANKEYCRIQHRENARRRRRAAGCKIHLRRTPEEAVQLNRERARAYREADPDRAKAHYQTQYQSHKAIIIERSTRWASENKQAVYAIYARRRARKLGASLCDLTHEEWLGILEQFGHRCAYCHAPLHRATQDHVVPLATGGNHTMDNIVPCCRQCNASKLNKSLHEWARTRFLRFTHGLCDGGA